MPSGSMNRRTTVSVDVSGRVAASSPNAPPVSTADSWHGSPTSSSLRSGELGLLGERGEGEGAGHAGLVDDQQLPGPQPPPVELGCGRRPAPASSLVVSWPALAACVRRSVKLGDPLCAAGCRCCWASHWAVLSVTMPRSAARTCAAFADGASPTTVPGPYSASHIARTPAMDVVLPVPAGPTSTSTTRPEVTIWTAAGAWSSVDRAIGAAGQQLRGDPCGAVAVDGRSGVVVCQREQLVLRGRGPGAEVNTGGRANWLIAVGVAEGLRDRRGVSPADRRRTAARRPATIRSRTAMVSSAVANCQPCAGDLPHRLGGQVPPGPGRPGAGDLVDDPRGDAAAKVDPGRSSARSSTAACRVVRWCMVRGPVGGVVPEDGLRACRASLRRRRPGCRPSSGPGCPG